MANPFAPRTPLPTKPAPLAKKTKLPLVPARELPFSGGSTLDEKMTALAKELATGIGEIDDVLAGLEITQAEYLSITKHRRFATLLAQFKTEWENVDNTPKRVRMKAALALEQCIPEMVTQVHNRETPLAARAALVTAMGKIAGFDKQAELPATGSGFKVTINLGTPTNPQSKVAIEAPIIEGELA